MSCGSENSKHLYNMNIYGIKNEKYKQDYIKNQSENTNLTDKNIFNCKINILIIDTPKR